MGRLARLAWTACVLLLLLVPALAPARPDGAGRSAAKACEKSERKLVLAKKRGKLSAATRGRGEVFCLAPSGDDPVKGAVAQLKALRPPLSPQRARFNRKLRAKRTKLERRKVGALVGVHAALEALAPPAAAARRGRAAQAGRVVQTPPETTGTGEGGEWTARGSRTRPAPGEAGQGFYSETETVTRQGRKVSRGVKGWGVETFFNRCPDTNGLASGTTKVRMDVTVVDEADGLRQIVIMRVIADVKFRAEVGEDARLRSFDFDGTLSGTQEVRVEQIASGRVVSRDPTTTVVGPYSAQDVDPRNPLDDSSSDASFASWTKGLQGPGRALDLAHVVAEEWSELDDLGRVSTADELVSAEHGWYDGFGCASLAATPAQARLKRGGSTTVAVKVNASDGSEITGPKLEARLTHPGGELSPAADSPATLTLSDPRSEWAGSVHLEFLHTSKRGRARTTLELPVEKGQEWKVEFEGTVEATADEYAEAFMSKHWRKVKAVGFWKLSVDRVRIAPGEKTQAPDPCEFGGGTCEIGYTLEYHSKVEYEEDTGTDEDATCNTGGVIHPAQKFASGVNAHPYDGYVDVRALFPSGGFVTPCTGTDSELEWSIWEMWEPSCVEPPHDTNQLYNIQKIPNEDLLNKDVLEFDLGKGPVTSSCKGGPWSFSWRGKARFTRL